MHDWEWDLDKMHDLWMLGESVVQAILSGSSRLYPLYVLSMIIICFGLYVRRGLTTGFLAWVFPRKIYGHPSHATDVKLLFFGKILAIGGVLNVTIINIAVVYYMQEMLGKSEAVANQYTPFLVGFIYLVVGDFCTYWVHRIHHEWKVIWPFHSVHHSAEVMTPITLYRKHPIYDVISKIFRGVLIGVFQGLVLSLLVGKVSIATIVGMSSFYFIFNFLGANLRHSHIWLSYGRFLEHIFISPAQHQIHHSLAHKHWHKNYGEVFAIWDWAFGTLYVPQAQEDIEFGLSDEQGRRIEQPYPSLTDALCKPVRESWAELSRQEPVNLATKSSHVNPK